MDRWLLIVLWPPCAWALELAEWVTSLGGFVSPKLEIKTGTAGRGLFVSQPVQQGETLLSIPFNAILLGEKAVNLTPCQGRISEFFDTAAHPENVGTRATFSIMVFLLHISIDPQARKAWPHLDFLLNHWDERQLSRFPLFWASEMLADIAGTTAFGLYSIARTGVEREYTEVLKAVCPELASGFTLKSYKNIWALVNSRILTFPGSPEGLPSQPALVPIFDMVNHHLPVPQSPLETEAQVTQHEAKSLGRFGPQPARPSKPSRPSKLHMWPQRAMESGQEVTDVYGLHSNQEMLWKFGFTVPWIHNLTCLTKTRLSLDIQKLRGEGGGGGFPPDLLSRLQPFLHFELGGCPKKKKAKSEGLAGHSLAGVLSFLRAWLASSRASLPELHRSCSFESPEACRASVSCVACWSFGKALRVDHSCRKSDAACGSYGTMWH